jgi:hypothetical protein
MHFGIRKKRKKTKPNLTGPLGAQYPNPSRAWHFRSRRRRLCSSLSPTLSLLSPISLSSHLSPPSRLSLYRVRQGATATPEPPSRRAPCSCRAQASAQVGPTARAGAAPCSAPGDRRTAPAADAECPEPDHEPTPRNRGRVRPAPSVSSSCIKGLQIFRFFLLPLFLFLKPTRQWP